MSFQTSIKQKDLRRIAEGEAVDVSIFNSDWGRIFNPGWDWLSAFGVPLIVVKPSSKYALVSAKVVCHELASPPFPGMALRSIE